jgi:hypothetical protein
MIEIKLLHKLQQAFGGTESAVCGWGNNILASLNQADFSNFSANFSGR